MHVSESAEASSRSLVEEKMASCNSAGNVVIERGITVQTLVGWLFMNLG